MSTTSIEITYYRPRNVVESNQFSTRWWAGLTYTWFLSDRTTLANASLRNGAYSRPVPPESYAKCVSSAAKPRPWRRSILPSPSTFKLVLRPPTRLQYTVNCFSIIPDVSVLEEVDDSDNVYDTSLSRSPWLSFSQCPVVWCAIRTRRHNVRLLSPSYSTWTRRSWSF